MPEQTASTSQTVSPEKARYLSKWNALFDRTSLQYLTFKPMEGITIYPCYGCRDLCVFAYKDSFLDHINRRGMMIQYVCRFCPHVPRLKFYNPCSLLLHAREHFQPMLGELDLNDVTISLVPLGMAGFFEHPDVPLLFNVEEDSLGEAQEYSSRFYSPTEETKGCRIVQLKPVILLFYASDVFPPKQLILKQTSSNMPSCKFIDVLYNSAVVMNPAPANITNMVQKKRSKYKKQKVELELNETVHQRYSRCPECYMVQKLKMTEHFRGDNRPNNDELKCTKCKYIASSICSLKAHERIHGKLAPFVCPECGKNFDEYPELMRHMDDVCFHMSKTVRHKCMGRNCSKIFATTQSFGTHFSTHFEALYKCDDCGYFYKSGQTEIHSNGHNRNKYYVCGICQPIDSQVVISPEHYLSHLNAHCQDPNQRVYVYNCKSCRSYFRSHETFAVHVLRCTRETNKTYSSAGSLPLIKSINQLMQKTIRCNKCDQTINENTFRTHYVKCNFKPAENEADVYNCKLCDYSHANRNDFRKHVIAHRHIATSYQCMDCGECFLVKPSLKKHLSFVHQVADVDLYFEENDCFDEEAIRAAKEPVVEPVEPNQCGVCRLRFNDELELSKHLRIHGMAFLKNNMK